MVNTAEVNYTLSDKVRPRPEGTCVHECPEGYTLSDKVRPRPEGTCVHECPEGYTKENLIARYLAGEKFKFLFFWGHTAEGNEITQACLSQWWSCRFVVDEVAYSCAEQYMMAEKARMFHDEAMLEMIMRANHPKEMKAYGRAVQNFVQEQWDSACYNLVKKGNMAKFSQNPKLLDFLKCTTGRILVEASPRDRIWGIGMGKNNPDAENPLKWRGKNLLGFALTEVRDCLCRENRTENEAEKVE